MCTFDRNQPRPLPPGEIDPEVLTKWFHDALGVLRVEDSLKRFFWDRNISEIQQFLIRSRQELQHFWAYNSPYDPRRVRRLVPRIASFLHKRIERWSDWIPEMVLADIVLDETLRCGPWRVPLINREERSRR